MNRFVWTILDVSMMVQYWLLNDGSINFEWPSMILHEFVQTSSQLPFLRFLWGKDASTAIFARPHLDGDGLTTRLAAVAMKFVSQIKPVGWWWGSKWSKDMEKAESFYSSSVLFGRWNKCVMRVMVSIISEYKRPRFSLGSNKYIYIRIYIYIYIEREFQLGWKLDQFDWKVTHDMLDSPQTSSLFFCGGQVWVWSFLFLLWLLDSRPLNVILKINLKPISRNIFRMPLASVFLATRKDVVKKSFAKASTKSIIEGDEGRCLTRLWTRHQLPCTSSSKVKGLRMTDSRFNISRICVCVCVCVCVFTWCLCTCI